MKIYNNVNHLHYAVTGECIINHAYLDVLLNTENMSFYAKFWGCHLHNVFLYGGNLNSKLTGHVYPGLD